MKTVLLLILSNIFMTFAWYGHLKFKSLPLGVVILASWLIALPEYLCQVPANRIGHGQYGFTAAQLKIMQEVITLTVFVIFSVLYLKEAPRWNELLGLVLIGAAVFVVFALNPRTAPEAPTAASPVGDLGFPREFQAVAPPSPEPGRPANLSPAERVFPDVNGAA
jgi:uncharacterized protein (DUF486 family)